MSFPQGINFRQTVGYVSDGTNEDAEENNGGIGSGVYPRTTAQGNTVGWEAASSAISQRNRNSANDRRLAGMNFYGSGAANYRIDLPSAGSYDVRLAAGDATYAATTEYVELFDTTTSLGVLCNGSTGAANSFFDATGAILTAANWPASNAVVTKTFATTICRFQNGNGATSSSIAHVNIAAGAVTAVTSSLRTLGTGVYQAIIRGGLN